ncbi:MAG: hypothetical protein AB7U20_18105 [Planctomycetaceae bacterium]
MLQLPCTTGLSFDQPPEPAALLAGVRENGERLRSGIYSATGTLEHTPVRLDKEAKTATPQPAAILEETIQAAFDHDQGKLYFSRLRRHASGERSAKFSEWRHSRLILRPEKSILVFMNRPDGIAKVSIAAPVTPQAALKYFQPVFDVRTLCLKGAEGLGDSFENTVGAYESVANSFRILGDRDDIIHLQGDFPVAESQYAERFEIWIDPRQGYQPIRYTVRVRENSESGKILEPNRTSETSWTQVKDVWVPKTVDLYSSAVRWDERLKLAITWESVNEPVPESWFTWEGLDLPEHSRVADTSIVDNVIVPVATVGKSMEEEVPLGVHEIGGYGTVRWLLILVNIIAAGLLLGWFLRRRASQ